MHLSEGLICARRHIHMPSGVADRCGIKNGDEVEVLISGGPRDLEFRQVLVRIGPHYKLEMHLDINEASAAGLAICSDDRCSRFSVGDEIPQKFFAPLSG